MKPVEENEVKEIERDYSLFLKMNNSELKAAYLAASGRGFVNIVKSGRDSILLERETDHKYIVCSYPQKREEVIVTKERNIRFHTDTTIFN